MVKNSFSQRTISIGLVLSVVFSGCVSNLKNPSSQKPRISSALSNEIAAGEQIHSQILSDFYTYTDQEVVHYVQGIINAMVPYVKREDLDYRVTILYNNEIYATSAPGGRIYVTTGFMNFLDNESELAAVLAHEIGYLQYRDPKFSKALKVLESVSRGTAAVGPIFGEIGALAVLGLAVLNVAVDSTKMTKEKRTYRADEKALQYMVEAGYDPQGLVDILYKFLNADPVMMHLFYEYYQASPITEVRFQKIQEVFTELPLEGKSFSTNRELYQSITKGVRQMYAA